MKAIIWALIFGASTTITYFSDQENLIKMEEKESKKGQSFGKGKTGEECFNYVMQKGKENQSLEFRMRQKIFLHHCFKVAKKNKDFCHQFRHPVLKTLFQSQRLALNICDKWGLSFVMGCKLFAEEVNVFCKEEKRPVKS